MHEIFGAIETRMIVCPELQVRVLISPVYLEKDDKPLLERLTNQYPGRFHVTYTTSVVDWTHELGLIDNHIKMLVVDETYFTMGGTNLDYVLCSEGTFPPVRREKDIVIGKQLPAGARDQDIVGSGPMAREMRQLAYKLFALWDDYNARQRFGSKDPEFYADKNAFFELDLSNRPLFVSFEIDDDLVYVPEEKMQLLVSGPFVRPNPITGAYQKLISEAEEEILIGNLYFCPAEPIMEALKSAGKRDVSLRVITNGVNERAPEYTQFFSCANRISFVPILYGRTYHFWEKNKCGSDPVLDTKIYEYFVTDVLYHKKTMVVDKRHFLIGSYNLGTRSDQSEYELAMVIDSPELAQYAVEIFERDLQWSREISAAQARDWYFNPITAYQAEVQKTIHGLL